MKTVKMYRWILQFSWFVRNHVFFRIRSGVGNGIRFLGFRIGSAIKLPLSPANRACCTTTQPSANTLQMKWVSTHSPNYRALISTAWVSDGEKFFKQVFIVKSKHLRIFDSGRHTLKCWLADPTNLSFAAAPCPFSYSVPSLYHDFESGL